jgi:hypothetical protein
MSKTGKILLVGSLVAGAGGLLIWAARTSDSLDKTDIVIEGIKKKTIKFDHSIHIATIGFINHSANSLSLDYPSIKVFHEGKEVGYSYPKPETVLIPAKSKKSIEVEFRINQVTALLSLLKTPKLRYRVQAITNVNGLETSQTAIYDISQSA